MKRTALAFFVLASITITGAGLSSHPTPQGRCNLTAADAPALRGIRLGMSTDQLLALFPASTKRQEIKNALEKAKAPDSEAVYLSFESADGNKDAFDGVAGISVGLYRGHTIDVSVQYVGHDLRNIDEWIAKLSETLKLPSREAWQTGPSENPNKVLHCNGVEIEAAMQGGGGSVRIRNMEYQKFAEEQNRAAEEKKKRAYKP